MYFPRIPTPGKGGPSQPIYVDTNGEIQEIETVTGQQYLNLNVALANYAATAGTWSTARNFTVKDNGLHNTGPQVSVNGGQDVVLTLPATIEASLTGLASRASEAKNLRCCYAAFINATGYRLMATINPPSKNNACICLFRADFQLANETNQAKIGSMRFFVTVYRNNSDAYKYHWGYLSDWTLANLAIKVTWHTDNIVRIFANSTTDSACHSIKLSLESATNYNGTELADDKVILASNATMQQSLSDTELAADANGTGLNVRMNTAGKGDTSHPVYVDASGMVQQCGNVQEKLRLETGYTNVYSIYVSRALTAVSLIPSGGGNKHPVYFPDSGSNKGKPVAVDTWTDTLNNDTVCMDFASRYAARLTTLYKGSAQQPIYIYDGRPEVIPINTTNDALELTVMRAINATNAQTAQNALGVNGKTIVIGSYGGASNTIYLA